MAKRAPTPKEIAARLKKESYSLSLSKHNYEKMKALAEAESPPLPVSNLIDEAIAYYLDAIKENPIK